jgi:GMP synthase (glutamine-hydrolysing)
MNWWIVTHVPFEGPVLIAAVMAEVGITPSLCAPYAGDLLPAPEDCAGLVVMGGPMNALDDAGHPHLASERALIAACVERDIPVLGVCLGAQLLAASLGGHVFAGPAGEFGAGVVTVTDEGRADPVFGGPDARWPVVHWHGDTFDLPTGATLLAGSDRYPHQAFRIGRAAYGLQFHVELREIDLPMMLAYMPPATAPEATHLTEVEGVGRKFLRRFLALA